MTWRQSFTTARHLAERAALLQIDLRSARVDAASPKNVVGALRATVKAQSDATHAAPVLPGVAGSFVLRGRDVLLDGAVVREQTIAAAAAERAALLRRITAVHPRATRLTHPTGHRSALVACGRKAPAWLASELAGGDPVSVLLAFPSGRPRVAVSGGRVLVYRGRAYDDVGGQVLRNRSNPETFACVNPAGTTVLLGVVDGRSTRSRGVDYPELTAYMIRLRCYIGMTFDGGGSTTMVAHLPRHTTATVLNVPSDRTPRPVADSLLAYPR